MAGGRIIEIAIVRVNIDGSITDEYSTLVNPQKPIGRSELHGITEHDVAVAPTFEEIAGDVLERLEGLVIVGHNVQFDRDFLAAELSAAGVFLPSIPCLCTLKLAHRLHPDLSNFRLSTCCTSSGLDHSHPHEALEEARSTARLLSYYLEEAQSAGVKTIDVLDGELTFPKSWQKIPPSGRVVGRPGREPSPQTVSFLARIAGDRTGVDTDERLAPYIDLLDRALEDRHLTEAEASVLNQTATAWGLSDERVAEAHEAYLRALVVAALSDGWITTSERHDLQTVAGLLRLEAGELEAVVGEVAEEGS